MGPYLWGEIPTWFPPYTFQEGRDLVDIPRSSQKGIQKDQKCFEKSNPKNDAKMTPQSHQKWSQNASQTDLPDLPYLAWLTLPSNKT